MFLTYFCVLLRPFSRQDLVQSMKLKNKKGKKRRKKPKKISEEDRSSPSDLLFNKVFGAILEEDEEQQEQDTKITIVVNHDEAGGTNGKELDDIDFFPTLNHGGNGLESHALPPTRPCDEAALYVHKTNKRRRRNYAIACFVVIIVAGIISRSVFLMYPKDEINQDNDMQSNTVSSSGPKGYAKSESSPASDPNGQSESATTDSNTIRITPSALTSIKSSRPKSTDGGKKFLSVDGSDDETRVSFLRFDLSSLPKHDEVAKATLKLHLTSKHVDINAKVFVDVLPHGGEWMGDMISWNNPVEEEGLSNLESFSVTGSEQKLFEVDVTSAIEPKMRMVTFKLWTGSVERINFASEDWNGGDSEPELIVSLAN